MFTSLPFLSSFHFHFFHLGIAGWCVDLVLICKHPVIHNLMISQNNFSLNKSDTLGRLHKKTVTQESRYVSALGNPRFFMRTIKQIRKEEKLLGADWKTHKLNAPSHH